MASNEASEESRSFVGTEDTMRPCAPSPTSLDATDTARSMEASQRLPSSDPGEQRQEEHQVDDGNENRGQPYAGRH